MSEPFAKAGEPVTTEDGKVICYLATDLCRGERLTAFAFKDFQPGELPYRPYERLDPRVVRQKSNGGFQICINGEWRP